LNLLIDENLSPLLVRWANELGIAASAVIYVGLQGKPDLDIWRYAYENDQIVVTVNVGDFISLAKGVELHPGVIAFREAGLDRKTQWARLREALAYVQLHCAGELVNKILEVRGSGDFLLHTVPAEPDA
jgi:predicted nuclease of predicted toxin-antitoxin system